MLKSAMEKRRKVQYSNKICQSH